MYIIRKKFQPSGSRPRLDAARSEGSPCGEVARGPRSLHFGDALALFSGGLGCAGDCRRGISHLSRLKKRRLV